MSSKAESSKGVAATGNVTGAASRFPPAPHFTPPAASFDAATASPQTEKSPASSVGSYYPWLDVLRGASWIMVVIGHTLLRFQYVASMGVGIFFAISGWLITKIIIAQRESNAPLANFYTRRCLRILPLYAAVIIVTCTACYIFPGWKNFFPFLPDVGAPYQILPYLATFSSEYWRGGGGGMLVGHCWSLCVEERFYVFWPLILALCPNRVLSRRSLIVFAVAAWYLTLQKLSYDNVTAGLSFLPFPLLLGCGLAIFFPKARVTASNLLTIPLGFILLGLYVYYAHHKVVYAGFTIAAYSLHAGILAMGLVACGVLSRTDPRSRFWRLMQLLGKASYAAYLIHPIFTYIGIKIAIKTGHPELGPIVAVALCAPSAYALHRWFELPILAMRRTVELSARLRYLCAGLQVTPILVGLVFLFPWLALWQKALSMPQVLVFLAVAAVLAWLTGVLQAPLATLRLGDRLRRSTH